MNQSRSGSLWGAPGPDLPVSVHLHTNNVSMWSCGYWYVDSDLHNKGKESLGERSGEKRRFKENTRRMH